MSMAYRGMNEFGRAEENVAKSLEIEPANPRYLDRMIDLNILTENRDLAWQSWQKLKTVNPDNKKLDDFKQRINEL